MDYREALSTIKRSGSTALAARGDCGHNKSEPCPQLPGTVLRVFIPAGAVINLLNLIEVTSPSGICLIIRLPFLGGKSSNRLSDLAGILDTVKQAGGSIELVS